MNDLFPKYLLWCVSALFIFNVFEVGQGIYFEEINWRYAASAVSLGICAEILFLGIGTKSD